MRTAVSEIWHQFSTPLEGRVLHMYLDIKGLITCGVGNLIDPVSEALKLPWKKQTTGGLATEAEVRAAWTALKHRPDLAKRNVTHALVLTGLVLADADVDALVAQKLASNERYLTTHHFPKFAEFPADAELAILSMAWACGPNFPEKFQNFKRAVLAEDWLGALSCSKIREDGNPGVVPRNLANRLCFANAATVDAEGWDASELYWPLSAADHPPMPGASTPDSHALAQARAIALSRALDEARAATALSARQQMDTVDDEEEPEHLA